MFLPPPASWSGPSFLLPDPLQQAPPWFSCSHLYLSLPFPPSARVTQVRSHPFSVQNPPSHSVKVKVLTPRPHTIYLLTSLPSSLPLSPAHSAWNTFFSVSATLLTFPASGPLHMQPNLPGTLFPRQERASLTSFSFLLKSHWMHSLNTL